ncbi:cation-binding protein [Actinophytocola xinjiangensis]|uniref:Cation-binding protein n=1 Tax=Actinophytocola xinjiangensis TaxID=485602 RepID=A0A7Z0WFB9_9PSEU|nr:nitroreductase/quinone reductase family protein [Actinophytocola xinjiangensis]OLF06015.1 cation-binding protein [Actinophytocola xinjiangensis]
MRNNRQIIEEFRANNGRVGGDWQSTRLLLLTTTGAGSDFSHTVPIRYLPDGGGRVLVVASAGGSPRHPAWFTDLVARPRVVVEDGVFVYDAEATVLTGAERDAAFARAVEVDPGWGVDQRSTARVIPVVALRRLAPGPPKASSPGAGLCLVHDAFRRELRLVRDEVARSGSVLGAQLRMNCLTLCHGLDTHHRTEDARMFAFPGVDDPELARTLARVRVEHDAMAALLDRLRAAVNSGARDLLTTVDQLVAELESHLDFEERELVPLLDAPERHRLVPGSAP